MYNRRRTYEHGRIKRSNRKSKASESINSIFGTYVKLLAIWGTLLMLDFFTDFRFEFIWSCWLMMRTVSDSFRYQGVAFALFFTLIAITADLICYFLVPTTLIYVLGSSCVWIQLVWQTDRGIYVPTVALCFLFFYVEVAIRLRDPKNLPVSIDLCRPFAAHCIGYPVVTLGFGLKSMISHQFRLRRQRAVESQNNICFNILKDALPKEFKCCVNSENIPKCKRTSNAMDQFVPALTAPINHNGISPTTRSTLAEPLNTSPQSNAKDKLTHLTGQINRKHNTDHRAVMNTNPHTHIQQQQQSNHSQGHSILSQHHLNHHHHHHHNQQQPQQHSHQNNTGPIQNQTESGGETTTSMNSSANEHDIVSFTYQPDGNQQQEQKDMGLSQKSDQVNHSTSMLGRRTMTSCTQTSPSNLDPSWPVSTNSVTDCISPQSDDSYQLDDHTSNKNCHSLPSTPTTNCHTAAKSNFHNSGSSTRQQKLSTKSHESTISKSTMSTSNSISGSNSGSSSCAGVVASSGNISTNATGTTSTSTNSCIPQKCSVSNATTTTATSSRSTGNVTSSTNTTTSATTHTIANKSNVKNCNKEEYIVKLESDTRRLKTDIQSLRTTEIQLRGQIEQYLTCDRNQRAEISQSQRELEDLQLKINQLTERAQVDKNNLQLSDKRLSEERKQRQYLEQQLRQLQQQHSNKRMDDVATIESTTDSGNTLRSVNIKYPSMVSRSTSPLHPSENQRLSDKQLCNNNSNELIHLARIKELEYELYNLKKLSVNRKGSRVNFESDKCTAHNTGGVAIPAKNTALIDGRDKLMKVEQQHQLKCTTNDYRARLHLQDTNTSDLLSSVKLLKQENQRLTDTLKEEDKMKQELMTAYHSSLKEITELKGAITKKEYHIVELNMRLDYLTPHLCDYVNMLNVPNSMDNTNRNNNSLNSITSTSNNLFSNDISDRSDHSTTGDNGLFTLPNSSQYHSLFAKTNFNHMNNNNNNNNNNNHHHHNQQQHQHDPHLSDGLLNTHISNGLNPYQSYPHLYGIASSSASGVTVGRFTSTADRLSHKSNPYLVDSFMKHNNNNGNKQSSMAHFSLSDASNLRTYTPMSSAPTNPTNVNLNNLDYMVTRSSRTNTYPTVYDQTKSNHSVNMDAVNLNTPNHQFNYPHGNNNNQKLSLHTNNQLDPIGSKSHLFGCFQTHDQVGLNNLTSNQRPLPVGSPAPASSPPPMLLVPPPGLLQAEQGSNVLHCSVLNKMSGITQTMAAPILNEQLGISANLSLANDFTYKSTLKPKIDSSTVANDSAVVSKATSFNTVKSPISTATSSSASLSSTSPTAALFATPDSGSLHTQLSEQQSTTESVNSNCGFDLDSINCKNTLLTTSPVTTYSANGI